MHRPDLLFTQVADALGDAVVVANRHGEIVFVNRAMLATYGYAEGELEGRRVGFLKSGLMPAAVYLDLWPRLLSGESWRGQLVNRRKDGSLLDVELVISPVPAGPSPEGFVAIQRDMSAARSLERKAAQLATLGALVAGIVHDLKSPLTLVKGAADLARRKHAAAATPAATGPSMEFQFEFQLVERGARRLDALINEIMRLSRAEEEGARAPVRWEEAISSALLVLGSALSGVAVEVTVEPGIATVASYVDLERIVLNLVDNAAFAARQGGGAKSVRVAVVREGERAVLTFADSGRGIAREVRSQLFAMAVTTKPAGQGTGLGLLVVGELTRKYGGRVTVASSTAEGTMFRVELPAAPVG